MSVSQFGRKVVAIAALKQIMKDCNGENRKLRVNKYKITTNLEANKI